MNEKDEIKAQISKDYMPIIYSNIKKYRKESGYSIMQVAEILDLSTDYLRRIESKKDSVKTCSLKLLIKFSILYNRKLDDFIRED